MTDEELKRRFDAIDKQFQGVATKADLERVATKADLERVATKADLEQLTTSIDERFAAVHGQLGTLDRRLDAFATKVDLRQMSIEIRNHFDIVTEAFKADVKVIAEGHRALRATDLDLIAAQQGLEQRQDRLELRQLALEIKRGSPKEGQ